MPADLLLVQHGWRRADIFEIRLEAGIIEDDG